MAQESSFDIVCKIDMQEVDNAINQVKKEVEQRFDFKGSSSEVTLDKLKGTLLLASDDDFKLKNLDDILQSKIIKRGISLRALEYGKVEAAMGSSVRQTITLQQGIPQDKAKEIVKFIKATKMKLNVSIQGDQVRVAGKSIDDLQSIMKTLKAEDFGIDMQFINYR